MGTSVVEEIKSLGRYQIQGVLGKGAMGLVYDGLDPNLNRRVAIKTILTRKLDEEAARMISMRFEREVHAVARLNHPNIVQVYDFGTESDLAYIVMEFIKGRELKDYFDAHERFDLKTAFGLMIELLDALDFAHEAGIVHRDIKPGNVMVADGHVKLTDFGVARVEGNQGEATRAGALVGTPSYMSPEQVQGQKVDRRTDIFSAGIIFYQFLTDQKPFEGTQFALQQKIVMEDPVWPSAIVQVPPEFDRVVARALAKDLDQRYQRARDFADALKRILAGKPPEDPNEVLARPLPAVAPPASADPGVKQSEAEAEFWEEVKDSDDPEDLKLYIEQFPRGKFVEEAKRRISALGG